MEPSPRRTGLNFAIAWATMSIAAACTGGAGTGFLHDGGADAENSGGSTGGTIGGSGAGSSGSGGANRDASTAGTTGASSDTTGMLSSTTGRIPEERDGSVEAAIIASTSTGGGITGTTGVAETTTGNHADAGRTDGGTTGGVNSTGSTGTTGSTGIARDAGAAPTTGGTTGRTTGSATTGTTGGSSTGTTGATSTGTTGATGCNPVGLAQPINVTYDRGGLSPPPPSGGPISSGTYWLTTEHLYGADDTCIRDLLTLGSEAILVTATTPTTGTFRRVTNFGGYVQRTNQSYDAGTGVQALTVTNTCPAGSSVSIGYSASDAQLSLYTDESASGCGLLYAVYSLQ
jgi:hypothetical protein